MKGMMRSSIKKLILVVLLGLTAGCSGIYLRDELARDDQFRSAEAFIGLGTFAPEVVVAHKDRSCIRVYRTGSDRLLDFLLITFSHVEIKKDCSNGK